MPTTGGIAVPAGTFVGQLSGQTPIYSVLEFGGRTAAIDSATGEMIIPAGGGLAARTVCCFVDGIVAGYTNGRSTRASAAVFQRAAAGGSIDVFSLTSPEASETPLGTIPPPPAGFSNIGIVTREVGLPRLPERNFGSMATISRSILPASSVPTVEVYSLRPAAAGSLQLAMP